MIDEKQLARMLRSQADVMMEEAGPGRGPGAPRRPQLDEQDIRGMTLRIMASSWRGLAEALDPG